MSKIVGSELNMAEAAESKRRAKHDEDVDDPKEDEGEELIEKNTVRPTQEKN